MSPSRPEIKTGNESKTERARIIIQNMRVCIYRNHADFFIYILCIVRVNQNTKEFLLKLCYKCVRANIVKNFTYI